MRELHLTKKNFRIEWFSGTGKGGQHRNKHQNCCRIIHLETGIKSQSTDSRERTTNQREAFKRLVARLIAYYTVLDQPERNINKEVIRNYHAERNEVLDKASGLRLPYGYVVKRGEIREMIDARRDAMLTPSTQPAH